MMMMMMRLSIKKIGAICKLTLEPLTTGSPTIKKNPAQVRFHQKKMFQNKDQ
jgi:hypothetical protein